MELLLWIIPVVAIAVLALPMPRRVRHAVSLAEALATAIVAGFATWTVLQNGTAEPAMPGNLFYLDAVSAILLDLVALVGLLTRLYTVGYVEEEIRTGHLDPKKVRALYLLIHGFLFTMVLTLTLRNLGGVWIAIEATTLASVFLVGFHNGKAALEAAWKYIILCSVGITLAMVGIVFLNSAAQDVLAEGATLDWTALFAQAESLDGSYLKFAFIFLLIGFGTKAGLAPMHNWLPDAHSQAPSPVSALLSGVLLNAALYAILRTTAIVNRNQGSPLYTGRLLVAAGVLSVATAAVFLLTQKDYKRLLAYSSIEHMGLAAIGIGLFTPLSLFAAFYHMIGHSLTKSLLFLSSGTVLQKTGTRDIGKLNGLLKLLPVTGPAFLLGLVAIGGTPPFGLFASELALLSAIFEKQQVLLGAVVALLLALVFAGIVQALFRAFYPKPAATEPAPSETALAPGEPNRLGAVAVIVLFVLIFVTGFFLPSWLTKLIDDARLILTAQGGC